MIQGQNPPDKDISFFMERLFGNTLNQTHIEALFIFFIDHEPMDLIFELSPASLDFRKGIQRKDPVKQLRSALKGRENTYDICT